MDVVSSRDGKYKRVFVHLKAWPDSRDGNYFRDRLLAGDHVNIANGHDMLWRCVQSRLKRPTRQWMGEVWGEKTSILSTCKCFDKMQTDLINVRYRKLMIVNDSKLLSLSIFACEEAGYDIPHHEQHGTVHIKGDSPPEGSLDHCMVEKDVPADWDPNHLSSREQISSAVY